MSPRHGDAIDDEFLGSVWWGCYGVDRAQQNVIVGEVTAWRIQLVVATP